MINQKNWKTNDKKMKNKWKIDQEWKNNDKQMNTKMNILKK